MLTSAIRNKEDELGHELTDDEVREVAGKEVKKRTESIEAFEQAGARSSPPRRRPSARSSSAYAPEQLSDDAVDALVDEAIAADRRHLDARRWARSWAS